MNVFKTIIGGVAGLIIGVYIHITYVTPSIQGGTGLLVSGILTVASMGVLAYTGYKWDDLSP